MVVVKTEWTQTISITFITRPSGGIWPKHLRDHRQRSPRQPRAELGQESSSNTESCEKPNESL